MKSAQNQASASPQNSPKVEREIWMKLTYKGVVKMIKYSPTIGWRELQSIIENKISSGSNITISYLNQSSGQLVTMSNEEDYAYFQKHIPSDVIDIFITEYNDAST